MSSDPYEADRVTCAKSRDIRQPICGKGVTPLYDGLSNWPKCPVVPRFAKQSSAVRRRAGSPSDNHSGNPAVVTIRRSGQDIPFDLDFPCGAGGDRTRDRGIMSPLL